LAFPARSSKTFNNHYLASTPGQSQHEQRVALARYWIEDCEHDAIVKFVKQLPLEDYRRLTFMMLDRAAV
jgi:hypothetical protein